MPFQSKAQQKYLYAREPKVADQMSKKTPKAAYAKLPEKKRKRRGSSLLAAWKAGKAKLES